jgi:hypothetical protein
MGNKQSHPPTIEQLAVRLGIDLPNDFILYWRGFYSLTNKEREHIRKTDPKYPSYCKILWTLLDESKKTSTERTRLISHK